MSSTTYKNLIQRREHRERSQPAARAKLGLLEKHKDYTVRAKAYHSKEKRIEALQRKASFRNEDEFYHKMQKSSTKGGIHKAESTRGAFTAEELAVLKSQDRTYLRTLKAAEDSKIERLKSSLHFVAPPAGVTPTGSGRPNTHTVFVDTAEAAAAFDPAAYFDTTPEAVGRAFNRPRKETLAAEPALAAAVKADAERGRRAAADSDDSDSDDGGGRLAGKKRGRSPTPAAAYAELNSRMERSAKLGKLVAQMETESAVLGKGKRVMVSAPAPGKGAVFKWKAQRKK